MHGRPEQSVVDKAAYTHNTVSFVDLFLPSVGTMLAVQLPNLHISHADGAPGQVTLNGQVVTFPTGQDPDTWFVDWMHVYPPTLSKGEPMWISFHTR